MSGNQPSNLPNTSAETASKGGGGRKLHDLMDTSMEKIRQMVDVNTVLGDPITTPEGTTIIPISRVSYGFASGGSDLPSKAQHPGGLFAGGSGAGITINPIGFLVSSESGVRVIQIEPYFSPVDRALEKIPEMMDKLTALVGKFKKDAPEAKSPEAEDEPWPADEQDA